MPRISDLDAITALDADDLLVVIEDGAAKKVTVAELAEALGGGGGLTYEAVCSLIGAVSLHLFEDESGNPLNYLDPAYDFTSITGTLEYGLEGPGDRLSVGVGAGEQILGPTVPNGATWPYTQVVWVYLDDAPDAGDEYFIFDGAEGSNGMGLMVDNNRKYKVKTGGLRG